MIGRTVSHYKILEKLGGGGMGVVYRAEDVKLGRQVAVKFLPETFAGDRRALERFQREARAAASLSHNHICTIHEIDDHEGTPFIVMELLEGRTLAEILEDGPLPPERTAELGLQVAEALAAAHAKGITHRDVKPSNIFVTTGGSAKVVDFGLAKSLEDAPRADQMETLGSESITQTPELTADGTAPGTVAFMSPEQALGEDVDGRSDLFSLGAVLYEMATGRRAFSGATQAAVFDKILHQQPEWPAENAAGPPPALEPIVRKALEKDRQLRYQSAAELHTDLQRLRRDLAGGSSAGGTAAAAPAAAPEEARSGAGAGRAAGTRRGWLYGVAAVLTVAAAAALYLFLSRESEPALTESDTILLTDFDNRTGDAVFDGTLKQALAVKLDESPYLNIFPERQVRETLRFMNRPADQRIGLEVAQEICERQGIKALIAGEIAPLGSDYVVTLRALECRSGEALAREQVQVGSKERVLAAVGDAASRMRQRLGESLASVERFDAPVEEATTSSLEALRAFSLGERQRFLGSEEEAIPLYRRALELDPQFALAHARLGTIFINIGESERGRGHKARAYELRDRVSERERLYITAHYHASVTGDVERQIEAYELFRQTYPRDWTPVNNLAAVYNTLGWYEKGVEAAREARQLGPDRMFPYSNLGAALSGLGRFAEAEEVFDAAIERGFHWFAILTGRYGIAFLEGDRQTMERLAAIAADDPAEPRLLATRAAAAASRGRLGEARELTDRAVEAARRHNLHEVPAVQLATAGWWETLLGNPEAAVERTLAALESSRAQAVLETAALTLALAGEPAAVRPVIEELESRFTGDTLVRRVHLPAARAARTLDAGDPGEAVRLLEASAPYERGQLQLLHLRANALLAADDGAAAAVELQKILDLRGVDPTSPVHTLAHLSLARAHALAREPDLARRAYESFLALLGDADEDLPVLEQARAELAGLG